MKTSSDIKALFSHFGGKPDDYQEIGRESEARVARTRWPLLATLDLKPQQVPSVKAQASPDPAERGELRTERRPLYVEAQALDRTPPRLFAKSKRRGTPLAAPPGSPRSSRFSALSPETCEAAEPDAAFRAAATPPPPPVTVAASDANLAFAVAQPTPRSVAPSHPYTSLLQSRSEPVPPAVPSAPLAPRPGKTAWATTPDTSSTPVAAHSAEASRPASLLSRLFNAQETSLAQQAQDTSTQPLASVFDRLRGPRDVPAAEPPRSLFPGRKRDASST